jgi:hypothetical protein
VEFKLGPLGTSATYWPIVPAPGDWGWRIWWNELAGETEVLGENLPPRPLCPPQIPLDQTRDWTRATAVGSQRLTASAMAWPLSMLLLMIVISADTCLHLSNGFVNYCWGTPRPGKSTRTINWGIRHIHFYQCKHLHRCMRKDFFMLYCVLEIKTWYAPYNAVLLYIVITSQSHMSTLHAQLHQYVGSHPGWIASPSSNSHLTLWMEADDF